MRGEEIPQRILIDEARPLAAAPSSGPQLKWRARHPAAFKTDGETAALPVTAQPANSAAANAPEPAAPLAPVAPVATRPVATASTNNAAATVRRVSHEEPAAPPRLAGPEVQSVAPAQAVSPLQDPFGEKRPAPRVAHLGESSVLAPPESNASGSGLLDPPGENTFRPRQGTPDANDFGSPPTNPNLSPPGELTPPSEPAPGEAAPRQPAPGPGDLDLRPLDRPLPELPGTLPPEDRLPAPRESDRAASPDADCDRVYNQRDCCREGQECSRGLKKLTGMKIGDISLDTAPSFRPDTTDLAEIEEYRQQRLARVPSRAFKNREQQVVAQGKLSGFTFGRITITTDAGGTERIAYRDLSDDDLCFVAAWWGVPGLPLECALGDEMYQCRAWTPTTFTWKASSLCHKPLYFEEVQLERYGHDAGPVLQPVLSGAHFFATLPVLPYKMGIHPPNECRYALGYYRPGSCAPWLVPPIPLSARAALVEAGVVVGAIAILP